VNENTWYTALESLKNMSRIAPEYVKNRLRICQESLQNHFRITSEYTKNRSRIYTRHPLFLLGFPYFLLCCFYRHILLCIVMYKGGGKWGYVVCCGKKEDHID